MKKKETECCTVASWVWCELKFDRIAILKSKKNCKQLATPSADLKLAGVGGKEGGMGWVCGDFNIQSNDFTFLCSKVDTVKSFNGFLHA